MHARSALALVALASQAAMGQQLPGQPRPAGAGPSYATQFKEMEKIAGGLKKEGIAFDSMSATTWKNLSAFDREKTLKAFRLVEESNALNATQKSNALNELTAKADLSAYKRLVVIGKYQGFESTEEVANNKAKIRDWSQIINSPVAKPFNFETAAAIASYRAQLPQDTLYRDAFKELEGGPVRGARPPRATDEPEDRPGMPRRNPRAEVVIAGTPVPRDPGQPGPSMPATIRTSLLGSMAAECMTLAQRGDERCRLSASDLAPKDANVPGRRRKDPFNPIGFMEVVRIRHQDNADLKCSGTLISADLVLTAKHCVEGYSAAKLVVKVPKRDEEELAECQKALGAGKPYRQCLGFADHGLARNGVRMHQSADVALIKLAEPTSSNPVAKVAFKPTAPESISMAGYGDNGGRRSVESQNAIEVGWYSGKGLTLRSGFLVWSHDSEGNNSATCNGDSGGPIYDGDHFGYNKDRIPREIVAVTSKADREECENHTSSQAFLAARRVKDWLCAQPDFPRGADDPNGCARETNVAMGQAPRK